MCGIGVAILYRKKYDRKKSECVLGQHLQRNSSINWDYVWFLTPIRYFKTQSCVTFDLIIHRKVYFCFVKSSDSIPFSISVNVAFRPFSASGGLILRSSTAAAS